MAESDFRFPRESARGTRDRREVESTARFTYDVHAMNLAYFLSLLLGGFVTGTFGALLGLGGGVFLIPFLVLVLGFPMHQAIATSIVAVIATSSAGAAINLERRTVNMRLGMLLEIATVAGAIAGGVTANLLDGGVLRKLFSLLLLLVALLMIRRAQANKGKEVIHYDGILPGSYRDDRSGQDIAYTVKRIPGVLGVSFVAGNVSGLLGIGGGIFKVPAMTIISGIPMKAATATSNFMIGVTAAASAFIYFAHGHLNPLTASTAALGVLGGSFAGVLLGRWIHSRVLTWLFAAVMLGMAVELLLRK